MTATDPPAAASDAPFVFTVGVPASADEPDLAATLASIRTSADGAGVRYEIIVAVNGPAEPAPALDGARAFARAAGIRLIEQEMAPTGEPLEIPIDAAGRAADRRGGVPRDRDVVEEQRGRSGSALTAASVMRVLRLAVRSKVAAWNAIRAAARAPIIVFTDADVRLAPDAIGLLVARLDAEPALTAAAGREVAALAAGDGLAARVAALPHRFDFGNVPGRLYALRSAALPEPMPAHVLHEDAYLSVRLGRAHFAKVPAARVYLRPPTTWRDYLRQRVRNELGKQQLAVDFPELLRAHDFGGYPWRAFVRNIDVREYPLVLLVLATRVYARVRARRERRGGFARGWQPLASTKAWSGGPAATRR